MPVQKTIGVEKNRVCMKSCLHFYDKNVKSLLLGLNFSQKMFSFKLKITCYLYDAVNWKNNLSFNFVLNWLTFKQL